MLGKARKRGESLPSTIDGGRLPERPVELRLFPYLALGALAGLGTGILAAMASVLLAAQVPCGTLSRLGEGGSYERDASSTPSLRSSADGGTLVRHAAGIRAARRAAPHGGSRGVGARHRRHAADRGRHRHRQDARLSRARDPERPARAGLHRHEEPAGTDLLQGHPRARTLARRDVHRHADEGPLELPVPAALPHDGGRLRIDRHVRGVGARRSRRGLRIGEVDLPAGDPRLGRSAPAPAIAPSWRICRKTWRCGTTSRPRPKPAWAPSARSTPSASSRRCGSAPRNRTW